MPFNKKKNAPRSTPSPTGAEASALPPPSETFLGEASVLSGDLRFSDDVRIEGRIEGQIQGSKSVVVAAPAEVDATIEAESVEIHGRVVGDLHVRRQTILHKSACVEGEIHTAGIVVEEGARFRGVIVIGPEEAEPLPSLASVREPAQSREPAPVIVERDDDPDDAA